MYTTHALENVTTDDKTWSFTPSLLLYKDQKEKEEWINAHHYLLGKRAQDEPGQDPDSELIALEALAHMLKDDDLPLPASRLATLGHERDLAQVQDDYIADSRYRAPCHKCLLFACNGCAGPRPNPQIRPAEIVVKASPISGYGVFSKNDLAPGTLICEYNGEIIGPQVVELRSLYNVSHLLRKYR
jgi:hypothetical protein